MNDAVFMLLLLGAMNVVCFLPHYLINIRERPNPIEFLMPQHKSDTRGVKLFYTKLPFSDPWRINFDFSVVVLIVAWSGWRGAAPQLVIAALFLFGALIVTYVALMQCVFKRPPVLGSDISLLKTGWTIMRGWIAKALVLLAVVLGALGWFAYEMAALILQLDVQGNPLLLLVAAALLPSCVFHLFSYPYAIFIHRTVYSPILHMVRSFEVGRAQRQFMNQDRAYFGALNQFENLALEAPPNVVMLCIESYGGVVFRDADMASELSVHFDTLQKEINAAGLRVASVLSTAPLFSGGSWLSYTTFTYGLKIDSIVVHDRLFAPGSAFSAYDSLFHVLGRSGYSNVLLCPLGGVPEKEIDWDRIQRNFQADVMIDFDTLAYAGPRVPYLGDEHRYAPLDQYALNAAYAHAHETAREPFTLFYLTLNSHHPYNSPLEISADWRSLNQSEAAVRTTAELGKNLRTRYIAAMRYQLDMLTQFLVDHAEDNTIFVVFGDHQPPMVATDDMGTATPVHVIAKHEALVAAFQAGGYCDGIRPSTSDGDLTRHEDFMAMLLSALRDQFSTTSFTDCSPPGPEDSSQDDSPAHDL